MGNQRDCISCRPVDEGVMGSEVRLMGFAAHPCVSHWACWPDRAAPAALGAGQSSMWKVVQAHSCRCGDEDADAWRCPETVMAMPIGCVFEGIRRARQMATPCPRMVCAPCQLQRGGGKLHGGVASLERQRHCNIDALVEDGDQMAQGGERAWGAGRAFAYLVTCLGAVPLPSQAQPVPLPKRLTNYWYLHSPSPTPPITFGDLLRLRLFWRAIRPMSSCSECQRRKQKVPCSPKAFSTLLHRADGATSAAKSGHV